MLQLRVGARVLENRVARLAMGIVSRTPSPAAAPLASLNMGALEQPAAGVQLQATLLCAEVGSTARDSRLLVDKPACFSGPLIFLQSLFFLPQGKTCNQTDRQSPATGTLDMAAKLQIHAPYVLQALPKPLDGPDRPGRYLAGEVYGKKHGGKRRKRTELAVAIDGVAVYLYDVGTPLLQS